MASTFKSKENMGGLLQEGGKGYVGPLGRLFVGSSKAITQIIGGGGVGAGPLFLRLCINAGKSLTN